MATMADSSDTRERLEQAMLAELDLVGPTQLRLKQVADRAGVAISVIYRYFANREDLLAAALVHRFREVEPENRIPMTELLMEHRADPDVAERLVQYLVDPARVEQRHAVRVEIMRVYNMARQNDRALQALGEARAIASEEFLEQMNELEREGRFAPGVTGATFTRCLLGLLFGQTLFDDQLEFSVSRRDWEIALRTVVTSLFA